MRLAQLRLIAFGPFTDVVIPFEDTTDRPALHIVYGQNEAGKSSTLRALRAALFGFPHQTPDNFLHENPALRVGATLSAGDRSLTFVRRKGKRDTLLAEDGQTPLDDDALRPFLGNLREDEFFSTFALGHAELRAGGREVLEGQGRLGEMLFMATAGLPALRRVERTLQDEAGKLFLRTGRLPSINVALNEIAELRRAQKEKSLQPETFLRATAELDQKLAERAAVADSLATLRRDTSRLDRIAKMLPAVARRRQLESERNALGPVPQLPDGFTNTREALERESRSLAGKLERIDSDRQAAEAQLASLQVPEHFLAAAAEIERLGRESSIHEKAALDSRDRRTEAAQLDAEARTLLRSIRPDLTLDDVESLRLTRQEQVSLRESSYQQRELLTKIGIHEADLHRLDTRISQIADELGRLGPARSTDRLRSAVRKTAREGDLDASLAAVAAERAAIARRLESGIASLTHWRGTVDELDRLPVPSAATIDRFDGEFTAIERDSTRLRDRQNELESRSRDTRQALEQAGREGDVPTREGLRESRSQRDALWREFRQRLAHPHANQPETPIAEARLDEFETNVRHADTIADRLRLDAERVERFAALHREVERQGVERQQLAELEVALNERRDRLAERWQSSWPFLHEAPLSPREMREWSQQHAELRRDVERLREATAKAALTSQTIERLKAELAAAVAEFRPTDGTSGNLQALLDDAERLLKSQEADAERRRSLNDEQRRTQQERDGIEADFTIRRNELQGLQAEWTTSVARLGLPENASVETGIAVLDTLGELFDRIDRLAGLQQRIDAMHSDATRFESSARELAGRLADELSTQPYTVITATLVAQLREAESLRDRRNELRKRCDMLDRDRTELAAQAEIITADIQELCRKAQCEDVGALPAIERRAAERRRIDRQIEQAEAELLQHSGGRLLAEFLDEVTSVDADAIGLELEQATSRIDELQDQRVELEREITSLSQELSRMTGGADAASAAEDTEVVIARLMNDVEEYAKRKFAAKLLRDGRENFRKKAGNAVLDRAGELFATLTSGSFEGLAIEYGDNDEPRLVGLRTTSTGGKSVPVEGMSDGTADQLYLSLRLAGLSAWLDTHEPLPFIVDDILVHFDDARSAAALQALAAIARQTQVILFTHHEHVVEHARLAMGSDAVRVHTLGARARHAGDREIPAASSRSTPALF